MNLGHLEGYFMECMGPQGEKFRASWIHHCHLFLSDLTTSSVPSLRWSSYCFWPCQPAPLPGYPQLEHNRRDVKSGCLLKTHRIHGTGKFCLHLPTFTYIYHQNQPSMSVNTPVPGMVWEMLQSSKRVGVHHNHLVRWEINPINWQVLFVGHAGFLHFFRLFHVIMANPVFYTWRMGPHLNRIPA